MTLVGTARPPRSAPAARAGLDLTARGWALPWLAWALTRGLMLLGVAGIGFYRWGFPIPGDLHLYYVWAYLFQHGVLPYKDFSVFYPPGVLAIMVLPATSPSVFVASFLVVALACDAAAFGRLRQLPHQWGSWVWLVGAALAGPVVWVRLDMLVGFALVMALLDAHQGRTLRAAAWLGLGASIKLWPLLLVVPLVLAAHRRRIATVGSALAAPALLTAPVLAWGGLSALIGSLQAQAGRGLEIESVPAAPLAVARTLGVWPGGLVGGLSYQFAGPATHALVVAASVLMAAGVLLWLRAVLRRPHAPLVLTTLVLVAVLLSTSKVLSAQYAAWALAPAAVLGALGRDSWARHRGLWLWLGLFLLSTQALFPFAYSSVLSGGAAGAVVAAVHALAVVGLLVSAVKAFLAAVPERAAEGVGAGEVSAPLHPEGPFADNSPRMSTRPSPAPTLETSGRP